MATIKTKIPIDRIQSEPVRSSSVNIEGLWWSVEYRFDAGGVLYGSLECMRNYKDYPNIVTWEATADVRYRVWNSRGMICETAAIRDMPKYFNNGNDLHLANEERIASRSILSEKLKNEHEFDVHVTLSNVCVRKPISISELADDQDPMLLAYGPQAYVFKRQYRGKSVAVKEFKTKEYYERERKMLLTLNDPYHPNLLQMITYSDLNMFILFEHCPSVLCQVYPIWTYSYLFFLIPVFLLTDLLLYKPVIVIEAISYVTVWCLFVFGGSVTIQQIIEVVFGCATAAEVAYFSYIYVKVEREQFKRVTSYTRAAQQFGRFAAYALSQILIGTQIASYRTLNKIALCSLVASFLLCLFLPTVSWRKAYAKVLTDDDERNRDTLPYSNYVRSHFRRWRTEVPNIFKDGFIVKWSLWWALATCAYLQIVNYTQALWGELQENDNLWNGITEAVCPFFAIPVVLLMERVNIKWHRWGELFLCVMSLVDALLLLALAKTQSIWVMYITYIVYRVLYQAMITIAQFNLADRIVSESFGLVFGLNTFVALAMESILTAIVADSHGLGLSIRQQYVVYSCFHGVIAIIFLVPVVVMVVRYMGRKIGSRHAIP